MSLLWQAKSLKDFTRLEQVRPEQAQDLGGGAFLASVRFGDQVPGYSDARSLWDISQLVFREGDESAFGFSLMLPQDWIGWFPKNDELGNWPGNPATGSGGIHGASFVEFHHAPNDGNWNNLRPGSAPFYLGATDTNWRAYLLETDPKSANFGGLRPEATWLRPFTRGQFTDFVVHVLWSTDPAKGYLEIFADGQPWVSKFRSATLYPSTFVYPQIGIYRRGFIGDPSLLWQAPARSGVKYPAGFVPAVGARVFPNDGGYLQSVQFKTLRIGTTREDVMAVAPSPTPTPVPTPTPPAPQPVPAPTPTFASVDVAKATAGLQALVDTRAQLEKVTLPQLDAEIGALQQRRTELQARRDQIAKVLDLGDWGGGVVAK